MIRSPGAASSIAVCSGLGRMRPNAGLTFVVGVTKTGALPAIVTLTASIELLPLAAVTTSAPQCAGGAPRCCSGQAGTPAGIETTTTSWPCAGAGVQLTIDAVTLPIVTFAPLEQAPPAGVFVMVPQVPKL